jgi:hypothetical protein
MRIVEDVILIETTKQLMEIDRSPSAAITVLRGSHSKSRLAVMLL